MKLVTLALDDIRPYENNPRINDQAVDAVAESIRQCGYMQPIVIDEDHVVLAGHTRLKALRKLGKVSAECLICAGLTEEQKKKYRYLDNKTGEAAAWDFMKLQEELEDLDLGDLDFFNMDGGGDFTVRVEPERHGVVEYGVEEFKDESFRYECPECGFRFN